MNGHNNRFVTLPKMSQALPKMSQAAATEISNNNPLSISVYHNQVGADLLEQGYEGHAQCHFRSALGYLFHAGNRLHREPQPGKAEGSLAAPAAAAAVTTPPQVRTCPTGPQAAMPTWTPGQLQKPTTTTTTITTSGRSLQVELLRREEDRRSVQVFSKAIAFKCQEAYTEEYLLVCCAILEFNVALSYHQYYFKHLDHESALFQALKLYDACLSHALPAKKRKKEEEGEESGSSSINLLLLLASLNNKAQIYYELQDLTMVSVAADALSNIVQLAMMRRSCGEEAFFSFSQLGWFQLNATMMKSIRNASAA